MALHNIQPPRYGDTSADYIENIVKIVLILILILFYSNKMFYSANKSRRTFNLTNISSIWLDCSVFIMTSVSPEEQRRKIYLFAESS